MRVIQLKILYFIMKKWFSKLITHLFLVTQFFQPHWLLYQSKGRSRNIALQPINYIHVLANTISVPIQRLHPSKAAFQDRMHHCGTTKAVPFQGLKCALRFPGHKWYNKWILRSPGYPKIHCAPVMTGFVLRENARLPCFISQRVE